MNWNNHNNKLSKEFKFENFKKALEFVNRVGELAEKENHHPDIIINYNKVTLELTTHDEGKVTEKDQKLAKLIDQI